MNELEVQCNAATSYPKNLSTEDSFPHVNVLKHDFLDKEEKLLFCREGKALIDFLEFGDEALGIFITVTHKIPAHPWLPLCLTTS